MTSSGSSQRVWYVYSLSRPKGTNFTSFVQYNISNQGASFCGDKRRELPDPTPCRDGIIPDPDSIPLSILNHPLGKRLEIYSAAYDSPELALPPTEGANPLLVVLHLDFALGC